MGIVTSQATDRQREDGYVFQVMEQTMSKMYCASDWVNLFAR
jgi:hypothetical protein